MTVNALPAHDLPPGRGLTPADFAGIEVPFAERSLRPCEILFQQEDRSRDVHFLLSGTPVALYWTEDGREVIFTRFALGDHFGELAALDDGDRSLAVVAVPRLRSCPCPALRSALSLAAFQSCAGESRRPLSPASAA